MLRLVPMVALSDDYCDMLLDNMYRVRNRARTFETLDENPSSTSLFFSSSYFILNLTG